MSSSPACPVFVTSDPELLDELLQVAALAEVEPAVEYDPGGMGPDVLAAPLVVVGAESWPLLAGSPLAGQRNLVVAGRAGDDVAGVPLLALPGDRERLLALLLACGPTGPSGVVVAVAGGRGGAGASTLACALAVTAARAGRRVLLLDADPTSGGLDLVLGAEDVAGLRWPEVAGLRGPVSGQALLDSLPCVDGVHLLSAARPPSRGPEPAAVEAVVTAGARSADLVVADLGRAMHPAAEVVLAEATLALLVVPAEVRAVASALVAVPRLTRARRAAVVVRGPAPSGLRPDTVASLVGLPLQGWLRPEPGLAGALERGLAPARAGRGPLAELCRGVLG